MRATLRTLTGIGCVTAALMFAGQVHGQATMVGGGGSFSGGGSSSGGGGGGGGGGGSGSNTSSGQNTSSTITATQLQQSVGNTPSALNSFNNVGSGTTNGTVSTSNPLAAYYYNPLAQGYITINSSGTATPSNVPFGSALYGNLSSSTGSGSLGGRGAGNAFGGTSSSSLGSFGSTSSSSSRSLTGGTATVSRGTTNAILFTGSNVFGPAIGRRGPVMGAALMAANRPIALATRRPDLQQILARSSYIAAPGQIAINTDGGTVILTGTVATKDERRIAANLLSMQTGVNRVQNNLTIGPAPGLVPGPNPIAASPGAIPGPGPINPPPGTVSVPVP